MRERAKFFAINVATVKLLYLPNRWRNISLMQTCELGKTSTRQEKFKQNFQNEIIIIRQTPCFIL